MTTLYLVRHGKAKADFRSALDPGLDALGKAQAEKAAEKLAPLGPLAIVSSPLGRALETSAPLSRLWDRPARVEKRVSEIPSPRLNLAERAKWLQTVMGQAWVSLPSGLKAWRQEIREALLSMEEDTVVFSHFIAINAAVGMATGDDRVVNFLPDNGSITILEKRDGDLFLAELGNQLNTHVG